MAPNPNRPVTVQQMQALDRAATERFGIPPLILMENAGLGAARVVADFAHTHHVADQPIAIVCGRGNNGGDGFVIARHLHNELFTVELLFDGDPENLGTMTEETATHFTIVRKLKLPLFFGAHLIPALQHAGLIVDALLGIGVTGTVRERQQEIIDAINARAVPTVAIDIPSGLDGNTGHALGTAVVADQTVTFGRAKSGLFTGDGPRCVGGLTVAAISLPPELMNL